LSHRAHPAARCRAATLGKKDPTLQRELIRHIEPEIGGDAAGKRKFVRTSLRALARRLQCVSHVTVGRWLKRLGFSLRTNVKRLTGPAHPDRDRQFRFIQKVRALFLRCGAPAISVDTKDTKLIGNFKNPGARWTRKADAVSAHDFPGDADCRAVPYGIYDLARNHGHVAVGTSANTGEFAVQAIRDWWTACGRRDYAGQRRLLIFADSGGSNGCRPRLWKRELQQLADETGLSITVCHYPRGASKWNPVEHRLFSQISRNWAGQPLRSLDIMLAFIRGTTTQTGLRVTAHLDQRHYATKIKVPNKEIKTLNLKRQKLCPKWNYTLKPRQKNPELIC